jgi:hypothetical protein
MSVQWKDVLWLHLVILWATEVSCRELCLLFGTLQRLLALVGRSLAYLNQLLGRLLNNPSNRTWSCRDRKSYLPLNRMTDLISPPCIYG